MGLVQTKQGSTTGALPLTLTITLDNPTGSGAGNGLIVLVAAGGSSVNPTGLSCTLGGAADNFTQDATWGSASLGANGFVWRDQNNAGGQTSVAITTSGGSVNGVLLAAVYERNDLAASPFDQQASSSAASGAWSSTATATTSQASEFAAGAVETDAVGTQTLTGPSSPWVNLAQLTQAAFGFNFCWLSGWEDLVATQAVTYNGTSTGSSEWVATVVTYKLAAAGGPGTPATPYSFPQMRTELVPGGSGGRIIRR